MTPRLAVTLAAAALAAAALASPAGAVTTSITASQITSPSDPAYAMTEQNSAALAFTVSGTTTGPSTASVDIDCFDAAGSVAKIESSVPTSGNAFSVDVSRGDLYSRGSANACVLRAVPAGDGTSRPPSASSDPYQGPRLGAPYGSVSTEVGTGQDYDFDYLYLGVRGNFDFHSAGLGIAASHLYDPTTLAASPSFIGTDYASDFNGDLIKVDGAEGFVPYGAFGVPGWLGIASIHTSLDPATGSFVVQDREPLSKNAGGGAYQPAGVELDRTWTTDSHGQVAHLTDTWRSTDGQPHTLDLQYESSYATAAAGNTLDLPGSSGYHDYATGDSATLPTGPGTIYFKYDGTTPDAGDGTNPQGALTYEAAPDAPVSIESTGANAVQWLMPYNRTIPAGGSTTLRFSWGQAFSRGDLDTLAQQAIASWTPPPQQQQSNPPASNPNAGTPPQQHQLSLPAGLSLIGGVKTTGNAFSFTVACTNGPCNGSAAAIATELLRGSKVLSVARAKHRKVTVGKANFTIANGAHKTITVKLNAAGKKLLKKFRKLPAKLTVTLNGKTAVAKSATLKPPKRKRR